MPIRAGYNVLNTPTLREIYDANGVAGLLGEESGFLENVKTAWLVRRKDCMRKFGLVHGRGGEEDEEEEEQRESWWEKAWTEVVFKKKKVEHVVTTRNWDF